MGDGHDHGHHGGAADGPALTTPITRRRLMAVVAAVLLAAVVGAVLLWPDGDRDISPVELGFTGELVDATVTVADVVPCAGTTEEDGILCTEVSFHVTSGPTSGDASTFQVPITDASVAFDEGDDLVLAYEAGAEPQFQYRFSDFQRRTPLTVLWVLFVLAVVALGRWQGVRALVGLLVTGVVMVAFLFPSILDGNDPTAVALVSAAVIGVVALYLTHGVSERTTVALLGTFGALLLTAALAAVFSAASSFTGFGSEDAYYLQVAASNVDIKGLVLAGIIIGSLGVLDDVTVTQVSAVWQLRRANPAYGARQLYGAAVGIGRDHIASTVNTLVLAYAGASLPLLLVYTQAGRSLGDVAVGELVAVEIVRTLVGSIGLVAAVPITTALAAVVAARGGDGAPPAAQPAVAEDPVETGDDDETGEPEEGWDRFAPREEPDGF